MTDWEPTKSDIAWTRSLIDTLSDGGMWMVPANCYGYCFDKTKRHVIARSLKAAPPYDETHARIAKVLGMLGYTVEVEQET